MRKKNVVIESTSNLLIKGSVFLLSPLSPPTLEEVAVGSVLCLYEVKRSVFLAGDYPLLEKKILRTKETKEKAVTRTALSARNSDHITFGNSVLSSVSTSRRHISIC